MIKDDVIAAFKSEFSHVEPNFIILDLLGDNAPMEYEAISKLKMPSVKNDLVWMPGVYVFIGNDAVYRVGVSMENSRRRVLQHLVDQTTYDGYCVWDIATQESKAILLFNVQDTEFNHWLLALEACLEKKFKPRIRSLRNG